MNPNGASLNAIATRSLEVFLDKHRAGDLRLPLSKQALQAAGLKDFVPVLELLNSFENQSLALLIQIVLEERIQWKKRGPELVWTGPEPETSRSRDTRIVLKNLLERVQRRIIIAGYRFTQGTELLAPLYQRMCEAEISALVFIDIERPSPGRGGPEHIQGEIRKFIEQNWSFGSPYPSLFIDPRTAESNSVVSMHAKCVVVDEEIALIGSANFTVSGQMRNIEAGVLIEDKDFAGRVAAHWQNLITQNIVEEMAL